MREFDGEEDRFPKLKLIIDLAQSFLEAEAKEKGKNSGMPEEEHSASPKGEFLWKDEDIDKLINEKHKQWLAFHLVEMGKKDEEIAELKRLKDAAVTQANTFQEAWGELNQQLSDLKEMLGSEEEIARIIYKVCTESIVIKEYWKESAALEFPHQIEMKPGKSWASICLRAAKAIREGVK